MSTLGRRHAVEERWVGYNTALGVWFSYTNLFLFHLPSKCNDATLMAWFSPYGPVVSVKVMRSRKTGGSRGYGFVRFLFPHDATRALYDFYRRKVGNKILHVDYKTLPSLNDTTM